MHVNGVRAARVTLLTAGCPTRIADGSRSCAGDPKSTSGGLGRPGDLVVCGGPTRGRA